MSHTTSAQLAEAVKAYRSFGSKMRAQHKAGTPDAFIARNRRFQKVLVGKLAEAGHMDLALALADEQVALGGISLAVGTEHDTTSSRALLRNARRTVKATIESVMANEAQESSVDVAPSELHMRREDSTSVWRVLGIDQGTVWLSDAREPNYWISRSFADLIEDEWVACDPEGHVHEHDASIMTLAELVRLRRSCARITGSPVRLEDSRYVYAARYTEEVDQELYLRRQTGLRSALITEANADKAIRHGEHHEYGVHTSVYAERVESRRGIDAHLTHSGHLVRD